MILVRGGNIGKNFLHEFFLSPALQWRRQNFGSGSGGHLAQMYLSKTFEKFAQKFKKFSKIFQK